MEKTDRRKRSFFKTGSRSPEIIRLWRSGVRSPTEIGLRVGSTPQNVIKTLKRNVPEYTPHRKAELVVDKLSETEMAWLRAESRKSGVKISEMARAMLVDAIAEEMEAAP